MATLAIGAIGAAIGNTIGGTFLGMSAASLGWNIGLTVGGMLFGPKGQGQQFEGPRLSDLKIQASTYGNAIPKVYGVTRIAGNMIWSKPITETAHVSTQSSGGGKGGGGGGSVTTTTYTYSQSFAVAICEGEIAGVRRIWANGKLIYNLDADAALATIVASGDAATGITIYTGTETQDVDPIIEADVGAANCPAYRGTAYIVFDALQLADYGNRAPNLEFEVVSSGADSLAQDLVDMPSSPAMYGVAFGNGKYIATSLDGLNQFTSTDGITYIQNSTSALPASRSVYRLKFLNGFFFICFNRGLARSINGSDWTIISGFGANADITDITYADGLFMAINQFDKTLRSSSDGYSWSSSSLPTTIPLWSIAIGNGSAAISSGSSGTTVLVRVGGIWGSRANLPFPVSGLHIVYGAGVFSCVGNGRVFRTTDFLTYETAANALTNVRGLHFANGLFAASADGGNVAISHDGLNYDQVKTATGASLAGMGFGPRGFCCVTFLTRSTVVNFYPNQLITAASVASADIITDICERAGLSASDIDVTGLSSDVGGYVVQRSTARSQLEQLANAYYFDAIESDGKIKFVERGGASVLSIAEADLAARSDGAAPGDPLRATRRQEMELPAEVTVQYMDSAAAHIIGSQRSQRLTTDSENRQSINFAISMTASKAKQVSDVLMYSGWAARTSFSFQTGWKYSYLEPTDVIDVTANGRTYAVRITDEDFAAGISTRTAVFEDAEVYSQTATAAALPAPDDTVGTVPLTNLVLLDIPLLRDQDDGVGFYGAAAGYGDGWTGTQVFKSLDGGTSFSSYGPAILFEATIGLAATALGAFTQNIFDETNSVTVTLTSGELSSVTEAQVLNGANAAMLGSEMIQFRDATLTAADTYKLTGLLRGRRGTEWAIGTHAVGDQFVLLDETTLRLFPASSSEYDVERHYRGASFGGFLDDAYTVPFENTAVAQTPYAPVLLGGGRNAAGDLTIKWNRRTRISGGWNNYSDVPVGEESESYEIDIYSSGTYATVVRTITATSQTASYTAAQQTTDFGAPQGIIYVGVFQMSASVGRGYELRGAI